MQKETYQASRFTKGNLIFPDRIQVMPNGVHYLKRAMFGATEERISYKAIASIKTQTRVLFADLTIESSGGNQPITINGLYKRDALEIKKEIERLQES